MRFSETPLKGAYVIELDQIKDVRGFFSDTYCDTVFADRGLEDHFVRGGISYNLSTGTLRGMHLSASPYEEVKLVRCTNGIVYDVIIDLRKDSETYCQWFGIYLSVINYKMLYIPEEFAHGYITMAPNTEVSYQISEHYNEKAQRGVRFDDKRFGIQWPIVPVIMSDKDRVWPDFED